jgi:hypothetical protein
MTKTQKLIKNLSILVLLGILFFMFNTASPTALIAHQKSEKSANYGPSTIIAEKDFEFGKLFLCKYDKWFSCNTVIKRFGGLVWYPGNQVYGNINDTSLPINYFWHGSRYRKDYMLWMVYGVVNDKNITSIKLEVELDGQTISLKHPQLYNDMFLFTWNSYETDYKPLRLIGLNSNSEIIYEKELY